MWKQHDAFTLKNSEFYGKNFAIWASCVCVMVRSKLCKGYCESTVRLASAKFIISPNIGSCYVHIYSTTEL